MKKGLLERIYGDFEAKCFPDCHKHPELKEQAGIVKIDYIIELIQELQKNEYDAHLCIAGQNGNGKSMLLLALMKKLEANSIANGQILYAFHKHSDFIKSLATLNNTVLGVDELGVFFNYRMSMATESIILFNMIEVARANRVAVISCCRDARRINNNYRNGKISIIIWLIDRMENSEVKSYGLVFVGNPVLEDEDKFKLNAFSNINTFEEMRITAESLPTFYGYLFMGDVLKYVSKEELKSYKENKKKGMAEVYKKHISNLARKEESLTDERREEIDKLLGTKKKEREKDDGG